MKRIMVAVVLCAGLVGVVGCSGGGTGTTVKAVSTAK